MARAFAPVALAALFALFATRPAHAEIAGTDEIPAGPWYGWQLILVDAAAITALLVPVSSEAGPFTRGMGMTTFLMSGAVLHMANRNPRSASVSLLRLPLLLLGRLAGSVAGNALCGQVDCVDTSTTVGTVVGVAPVVLFDWLTARRPPRLFYAGDDLPRRPRLPPPRLEGWAFTWPLAAGAF